MTGIEPRILVAYITITIYPQLQPESRADAKFLVSTILES